MDGAAHHLDLREPNAADPDDVVNARKEIIAIMNEWITNWQSLNAQVQETMQEFIQ